MNLRSRRWLVVLLCLASLFNGFAAAATVPAPATPCEMGMDHDGDKAPCGEDGHTSALCAEQCAAFYASVVVAAPVVPSWQRAAERVDAAAPALFDSLAGPPGFQPPR
jgi:hypothetical protein